MFPVTFDAVIALPSVTPEPPLLKFISLYVKPEPIFNVWVDEPFKLTVLVALLFNISSEVDKFIFPLMFKVLAPFVMSRVLSKKEGDGPIKFISPDRLKIAFPLKVITAPKKVPALTSMFPFTVNITPGFIVKAVTKKLDDASKVK